MSSLRQRQKQARHLQILHAARKEFSENGFSQSRMDDIAEKAEVGVATLYTYFESKAGLLKALHDKDFAETQSEVDAIVPTLTGDPVESVLKVLNIYHKITHKVSFKLTSEIISESKNTGLIRDSIQFAHNTTVDQIEQVLRLCQQAGTISKALNLNIAAKIIVDLSDRYLSRLASAENATKHKNQLNEYIQELFGCSWAKQ